MFILVYGIPVYPCKIIQYHFASMASKGGSPWPPNLHAVLLWPINRMPSSVVRPSCQSWKPFPWPHSSRSFRMTKWVKLQKVTVSYGFLLGALFRFLGLGWLGLVATSVNLDFDVVGSVMSSTSQERMLDPPIAGSGAIWANLERRRDTTSQCSHGSPLKSRCGA